MTGLTDAKENESLDVLEIRNNCGEIVIYLIVRKDCDKLRLKIAKEVLACFFAQEI